MIQILRFSYNNYNNYKWAFPKNNLLKLNINKIISSVKFNNVKPNRLKGHLKLLNKIIFLHYIRNKVKMLIEIHNLKRIENNLIAKNNI